MTQGLCDTLQAAPSHDATMLSTQLTLAGSLFVLPWPLQLLLERHGGQVPQSFEELEALPGVGHKTASVVMAQAFGQPAFPVDTHIHRLATRWGLSSGKSVEQTEADLKALLPEHTW